MSDIDAEQQSAVTHLGQKHGVEGMITVRSPDKEWQCTECGHVVEGDRPGYCPDCNCVDGDRPLGTRLFIPRDACGWFE